MITGDHKVTAAAIALNAVLPGNDFHFGKSESGDDVASLGRY